LALHAELVDQEDPPIGREVIRVRHDDGRVEHLRLHDYERLYALPGVYEQIVSERLGCASPAKLAALLGAALDDVGWARGDVRVIDVAAGNGLSGVRLAAEGLHPVCGTDIVPAARAAALRDRPDVYDEYLTLDLLALSASQRYHLRALRANAVACVAPVGEHPSQVPTAALLEAVSALSDDALVAYMHDPHHGDDVVTAQLWRERLGAQAAECRRERYVHRRTVNGAALEMVGVVWRVRR
jgi:hypothetical protein